jgi:hypothetical protein
MRPCYHLRNCDSSYAETLGTKHRAGDISARNAALGDDHVETVVVAAGHGADECGFVVANIVVARPGDRTRVGQSVPVSDSRLASIDAQP